MIDLYEFYSDCVVEEFNDLHFVIKTIQSITDIEWYSLFYSSTKSNIKESNFITNNDQLALNYQKDKYINNNPIFEYCIKNTIPFIWDCNKLEKKSLFSHEIKDYGINHGISFPMHGINHEFGILTLSFYCKEDDYIRTINKNFNQLIALRDIILHYLIFLKNKKNNIKLSKREKEVCSWYLIGKTTWEISRILNCSEANINFHFKKIREKFNVNSRGAAIIKAIENGQIEL